MQILETPSLIKDLDVTCFAQVSSSIVIGVFDIASFFSAVLLQSLNFDVSLLLCLVSCSNFSKRKLSLNIS